MSHPIFSTKPTVYWFSGGLLLQKISFTGMISATIYLTRSQLFRWRSAKIGRRVGNASRWHERPLGVYASVTQYVRLLRSSQWRSVENARATPHLLACLQDRLPVVRDARIGNCSVCGRLGTRWGCRKADYGINKSYDEGLAYAVYF